MRPTHAMFIAILLAPSALAVAQNTDEIIPLICGLDEQAGSWVVQPNEVEGSILINSAAKFPASFSDSSISWRMGLKGNEMFFLSINRYTGDFVMGNAEFPVLRRGKCTEGTARRF